MEEFLYGPFNLSKIKKEEIYTAKNGDKIINISICKRRTPSAYGHTHYIKQYVPKDRIKQGENYFIGELKTGGQQAQQTAAPYPTQPQQMRQQVAPANDANDNDLPF